MSEQLDDALEGGAFTPTQIANSSLLTTQEKLELLRELKAKLTGADDNDEGYGFSPEEVDRAIGDVKHKAEYDAEAPVNVAIGRSGV